MKAAIMQAYFFPYIGYFQLMNAADEFVIYDNIEFTKKGWINRNRILVDGNDSYITLPLKKDHDYLDIRDRYLADTWKTDRIKMLNRISGAYRKAPEFNTAFPLVEQCINHEEPNLFRFIYFSLTMIKEFLGISTQMLVSSTINIDNTLKSERKVIELCKERKAAIYINPIGGLQLYDKGNFAKEGIEIHFLKTNDIEYTQFNNVFVPSLSIIDVMMFNTREKIKEYLNHGFTLL
jgi:hypothetical protein